MQLDGQGCKRRVSMVLGQRGWDGSLNGGCMHATVMMEMGMAIQVGNGKAAQERVASVGRQGQSAEHPFPSHKSATKRKQRLLKLTPALEPLPPTLVVRAMIQHGGRLTPWLICILSSCHSRGEVEGLRGSCACSCGVTDCAEAS